MSSLVVVTNDHG